MTHNMANNLSLLFRNDNFYCEFPFGVRRDQEKNTQHTQNTQQQNKKYANIHVQCPIIGLSGVV